MDVPAYYDHVLFLYLVCCRDEAFVAYPIAVAVLCGVLDHLLSEPASASRQSHPLAQSPYPLWLVAIDAPGP